MNICVNQEVRRILREPEGDRMREGGGAEGNRTPDLDIANVALSQLSYGPTSGMDCAPAKRGG